MTTEEKIAELEINCKAMTAEIEKLKAELVEKNETVWIPEFGNSYMYIDPSGDVISTFSRDYNASDNRIINFNNAYHSNNTTREHLKWYANNVLRVQNKLMQLHELLCPDYFPDWEDDERKCYIYYCYKKNEWCCDNIQYMKEFIVYFNAKTAKKACEILNKEKFMMDKV